MTGSKNVRYKILISIGVLGYLYMDGGGRTPQLVSPHSPMVLACPDTMAEDIS